MILSANGKYEINQNDVGRWTCTCRDYKYRQAQTTHGECKHIKDVKESETIELKTDDRYKPRIFFERTVAMLNEMMADNTFEICGSYRREKEKLKDLDVVIYTKNPDELKENISLVGHIERGGDKAVTATFDGIQVDFKIVENMDHFWSMVMHFTGSKEENIRLRKVAKSQGRKLNEYGIEGIITLSEREIYAELGEEYKEPRDR